MPDDRSSPATPPGTTRPASLWPESTRAGELASTQFALSRFDPLADERQRGDAQLLAAFDVCHPALALRAVVLVQLVLFVGALVVAGSWADLAAKASAGAFAGVAGAGLWLVAVCALKPLLRKLSVPARGLAAMLLGAASALAAWWPLEALHMVDAGGSVRATGAALAGAGLALLLWAWLGQRARVWQPAQAHARLVELQSRIRPHFLFNALNTALALVRVDPGRAESVLEDLSELFRVALADVGMSVSLQEEIDLAQRYLAIEQVRFGKRLSVQWDIDPRAAAARVPPLVLQPLVENAVRHGVEPSVDGSKLSVRASVKRGQMLLVVSNTVGDEPSTPGHGMALQNVRERLRLLHDVAGQCDVWLDGGVFYARIIVPL
jgi:two-component system, LytTR family, sensor histidine kinase AlgZ